MTVSPALLAGRYRLLDPLGTGGMGRVWKARDEVLRRDVAIKEVNLPQDLDPAERDELRIRTLREARTAARLSHPSVVQIYDVLGVDDRPWIVMEYIKSRSLQQILATDGPLTPQRAAQIGGALLQALVAAHHVGVLHRDVKPGNVLIADDGRVVLTDFGLATFDGGEGSVTRPGLVWGSPEYVAPERAKDGISSVEADLWSLGATLFAAVEGSSPYGRASAMATLTALATEKPPVPQRAGPLKPVLMGLLRRDPRARLRPYELDRMLQRVADPESRPRPRLLPRQRSAPLEEATEQTPAVPIASGSLPEPPTEVIEPKSPAATAPPRAPARRGPSRRAWLIATAIVAVMAVIAVVAVLAADDGRQTQTPRAGASTPAGAGGPVTTAPGPRNQETVKSTPLLPEEKVAPPPGWAFHREPGKFRISAPVGWIIERDGDIVRFREPGSPKQLSVEMMAAPAGGAWTWARQRDEAWSAGRGNPPSKYHKLDLREITMGDTAAEWQFTFEEPGAAMRTIGRCYTVGQRAYIISWTSRLSDYSQSDYNLAIAGWMLLA